MLQSLLLLKYSTSGQSHIERICVNYNILTVDTQLHSFHFFKILNKLLFKRYSPSLRIEVELFKTLSDSFKNLKNVLKHI